MSENSRYDSLHGDEDEIAASRPSRVSVCHECGSPDGCMCAIRRSKRPCMICGAIPCESPSACRAQARAEAEETVDSLGDEDDE